MRGSPNVLLTIGHNGLCAAVMMTPNEFRRSLEELQLSQAGAAVLLSVSSRSVRRWAEESGDIPGSVEQAIRAWLRLERLGLTWRPDSQSIAEEETEQIAEQIAAHRRHTIGLDALLERVKTRGGPAAPWRVELKRRRAVLGPIELSFYPLRSGSFSPGFYTRTDNVRPDLKRDWHLVEDALACIAEAVRLAGKDWARQ